MGLGAACDYLLSIGMQRIFDHEKVGLPHPTPAQPELARLTHPPPAQALGEYLYSQLQAVPGVSIIGPAPSAAQRTGLVAFTVEGIHTSDLAFFLDQVRLREASG